MSFGVVQTMIITLKNNDNMRSKRDKFKRSFGKYSYSQKVEYDFPKATPEVLKEIKIKIKKEKRQLWIKVIVLSMALTGGFIWMYFEL